MTDVEQTALDLRDDAKSWYANQIHMSEFLERCEEKLQQAREDGAALMDAEWQVWANKAVTEDGDPGPVPTVSDVLYAEDGAND